MIIEQRVLPDILPDLENLPPLLQRIYAARGVCERAELHHGLDALLPFDTLKGIDTACDRLSHAVQYGEKILIIGDFDADGATATALAVSALRQMGATDVGYLVPNRFSFGYGLTSGIVEVAAQQKPDVIITVDNGIASVEGVAHAQSYGIDVVVTDHHLPGSVLPAACAIVNPNQPEDLFPSKSIAGVGVIFYVMLALRRRLMRDGWFESQHIPTPNMAQYLDLVALGTVADVVALDQNNRVMVNQGLLRMRKGQCRVGIKALIEVAGREFARLKASDLGFALGPRLNAAGRLDDMSLGIECLLAREQTTARQYAQTLDDLNHARREIEAQMKAEAFQSIQQSMQRLEHKALPFGLCLTDPDWHQGVVGILAGRLKERYHRPTIIFAQVSSDELKGSARSVTGLNIRDILAMMDTGHPDLIQKFGGHAMAAGLSIAPKNFKRFAQIFDETVNALVMPGQLQGTLWTDGALLPAEITLEMAEYLQASGPWGQQFPEPCFDNVFEIVDQKLIGQQHHHLKLVLSCPDSGIMLDAVAFNIDKDAWPNYRATHVRVAYRLDVNVYQGRTKLQLMVEALEAV